MRRICYSVAASLDGYIAGPNGEYDWIVMDPDIDFGAMFARFDTMLIGRNSYEAMAKAGQVDDFDMEPYVFSTTLKQDDHPNVTIVGSDFSALLTSMREKAGKDIWLWGGGYLFRSLAQAGFVDSVEVAIIPVMLGGGIALFPAPAEQLSLTLKSHRLYEKTGILMLEYDVAANV